MLNPLRPAGSLHGVRPAKELFNQEALSARFSFAERLISGDFPTLWEARQSLAGALAGGQKPTGSSISSEELRALLEAQSKPLLRENVSRWLQSLRPGGQSEAEEFKKAFPRFPKELEFVRRLANAEAQDLPGLFVEIQKMYGSSKTLNIKRVEYREITDPCIDPVTGAPIRAGAYVDSGDTLVICLKSANMVGAFHEIYEHLVLPFNPDFEPVSWHTVATLAETGFSKSGLITVRDKEQLKSMHEARHKPLDRLIADFPAVRAEIQDKKFPLPKREPMRKYALAKADALHEFWESRHLLDLWENAQAELSHKDDSWKSVLGYLYLASQEELQLFKMIADAGSFPEAVPEGQLAILQEDIKVFLDVIRKEAIAGTKEQQGLTPFLFELVDTARDRLAKATGHADRAVEPAGALSGLMYRLMRQFQKSKAEVDATSDIPEDISDIYYLSLLTDRLRERQMGRALQDRGWKKVNAFVNELTSLCQWLEHDQNGIRAVLIEWPNFIDAEKEAAKLQKDETFATLPLNSPSPSTTRRLWRRALLAGKAEVQTGIKAFLHKRSEALFFLQNESESVASMLAGRRTREATLAFLARYNSPSAPFITIFTEGSERSKNFFWYYLQPVYDELLRRGLKSGDAGLRLAYWTLNVNNPDLWLLPPDAPVLYDLSNWLNEDQEVLDNHIDPQVVQRIAESLYPHRSPKRGDTGGTVTALIPIGLGVSFTHPWLGLLVVVAAVFIHPDSRARARRVVDVLKAA